MPTGTPVTQKQKDLIIQLGHAEGIGIDLIAERLGLNERIIARILRKHKVKVRRRFYE